MVEQERGTTTVAVVRERVGRILSAGMLNDIILPHYISSQLPRWGRRTRRGGWTAMLPQISVETIARART